VLRLLDGRPHSIELARSAYRSTSTGGEHSSLDLVEGENMLVALGMLMRTSTMLRPAIRPAIALHALVDDEVEELVDRVSSSGLTEGSPSEHCLAEFLSALGAAGEEAVVTACRAELAALGATDLVAAVERVSLVSDYFGFDVRAPRIGAEPPRLLEVKTQIGRRAAAFRFHLTRNEYDVGRDEPQWAMVACAARGADLVQVDVVGWCNAETLRPYLPTDGNGRWTEAVVVLPKNALRPGIPAAVTR